MVESAEKIVYTGGTFDIPHLGHFKFLKQISRIGKVTVSLNTDDFIYSYKGKAPIMSYEIRKQSLLHLPYVYKVIENVGGADSKPAIKQVNPDVIAIGTDWLSKNYYKQMDFTQDWLDRNKITLVYVPYTKDISTTKIKNTVLNAS